MRNICVIGPTYPYKGGISHFTTILVRELRKKSKVSFISWKRQYPAFLYPVELKDTESKNLIKEEASFILDFINPMSWIHGFLDIKKTRSELLILMWVTPIQAPIYFFISCLIKIFTSTKVMYICHNVLPHERKLYDIPLTKLAFSQADSFIVHSSDDKTTLLKLTNNKKVIEGFLPIFNMLSNKNKINLNTFKNKLNLKKNVLLFFGYIRPYKGLNFLIQAMPKILKYLPDTSLLVVGEFWSNDSQSYLDMVDNLKINDNVVFVSQYIPNEEVANYFSLADIVVLPYISATQSAVIQTAYAFDKPVISTPVGGLRDVVVDNVTGYFIKPKSSDDIVLKVKQFYKKPLNSKNIKNYSQKFGWNNYIKLIDKI